MPICFTGTVGGGSFDPSRLKADIPLIGLVNGSNHDFTIPHKVVQSVFTLFLNGQAMHDGSSFDFILTESGGSGTGFDGVHVYRAPHLNDLLTANYLIAA